MFRISLALLVCFAIGTPSLSAAEPDKDRCVLLISVDGLAGFYFDDPKADMPTIRALAKSGARASGMTCSFPTVTWPNHTTLVTGAPPAKHGVLGNNYLDRATAKPVQLIVDPLFDKDEIVRIPTIYDVAHKAGYKTAGVLWPASRNAKTLDWTVPDMPGDAWKEYGTPSWLDEMRAAGIPIDSHGAWCKDKVCGVMRDWLYVKMTDHVLQNHSPNLVLVHLVELAHAQHSFGPQTPEAYWAVSQADTCVRSLVEAVRRSKNADRTTIVIASDHGFRPIEKDIRPNVLLKALNPEGAPADAKPTARSVSQGGGCMVYVLDAARKAELLPKIRDRFQKLEGVATVVEEADFSKYGVASPGSNDRFPDLWLSAKPGYSFTDSAEGEDPVVPRATKGGTHGYLPDHPDLYATLVLSGRGIRPGTDLGLVRFWRATGDWPDYCRAVDAASFTCH